MRVLGPEKRQEIEATKKEKEALRAEMNRIIQIRKVRFCKRTQNSEYCLRLRQDLKHIGENQIADVISGLEFFRVLWAGIATDVQSIGEYLVSLENRTKVRSS